MRHFLISASILIFSLSAGAKKSPDISSALLKETTSKYRGAGVVELTVEKTLKTDLNPAGQSFSGKIFLAAGLFRIENKTPEKSTLVFDGDFIWNEQPPSADFPGPIQVSKTRVEGKGKSQILFATLLSKDPVTKNFKIISSKSDGDNIVYEAESLSKDLNVNSLTIKIAAKKKEVSEISYKDEIGNLTTMTFNSTKFISKKNPKLFHYSPPKGAQVTTI